MQIISTEVNPSSTAGLTSVEFRGDGGERIVVSMNQTDEDISAEDVVAKAQVMLLQAANFGTSERQASADDTNPSEAVESLRQEQSEQDKSPSSLQEGLEDTFPASDPVASTYTSTPGTERHH